MMFPIIERSKKNGQQGVTLLLAILVLAAITAISFSVATILLTEIKVSADLTRTEPAIYGANAITEQALFRVKRSVTASNYYATKLGAVSFSSPVVSSFGPATIQDKVPVSANTFSAGNRYVLYSTLDNPASGYGKVVIQYPAQASTGTLYVYTCQFDINNPSPSDVQPVCSDPSSSNSYWVTYRNSALNPGNSLTFSTSNGLNPNLQQEIVLVNGGTSDIYVQLTTYDSSNNPKGMPYFGKTAVDITGTDNDVARTVHVLIPNNAGQTSSASTPFIVNGTWNAGMLKNDFATWAGISFNVGSQAMTVQKLGRMCVSGNSQSHTVKLLLAGAFDSGFNGFYSASDVAGGSVSVNMSGCTPGQFTYASLSSPLTLSANTNYLLVSNETINGDQWYDAQFSPTAGAYVQDVFDYNNSYANMNGASNGSVQYWSWVSGYKMGFGGNVASVPVNFTFTGTAAPYNLALGRSASQSSDIAGFPTSGWGPAAAAAVDGKIDGNYFNGSVSHTNSDANAWWQVDLGASHTISSVNIYNRTDCCSARLSDYWVFVSNTPFNSSDTPAVLSVRANTWSSHQTTMPNPSTTIAVPSYSGRYVRVQLSGTDLLNMSEVQVIGQ